MSGVREDVVLDAGVIDTLTDAEVDKMLAKVEGQVKKIDRQQDAQDEYDRLYSYWFERLKNEEFVFVATENRYYEYKTNGDRWVTYSVEALRTKLRLLNANQLQAFFDAMIAHDRMKDTGLFTHREVEPFELNMLRTDHWLIPEPLTGDEQIPEIFDVLLSALGGEDESKKEHIEQVIWWKYLHPEDYEIPCLVFSGKGAVGKNTFVNTICKTIFGRNQAEVLSEKFMLGDFNGSMKGKTIILIDEMKAKEKTADALKEIVGNEFIRVNNKGGAQETIDNTALYMIATNNRSGGVITEGHAADRRWSIIRVGKSSYEIIMDRFGMSFEQAEKWYIAEKWKLSDPTYISGWLFYLMEKYTGMKNRPAAYHGDDYERLKKLNISPIEATMQWVFVDGGDGIGVPEYMLSKSLYDIYRRIIKDDFDNYRALSKPKFLEEALQWFEEHMPEYERRQKINFKRGNSRTNADGFCRRDLVGTQEDNTNIWKTIVF